MQSGQRGFTLIELMIVVSIISILVTITLPTYQDYTIRARMSEVILAGSACRTAVTEAYTIGGTSPGTGNWGCEGPATSLVSSIDINADGGIRITVASGALADEVNGDTVLLIPINSIGNAMEWGDTGGIHRWACGPGTIEARYLPGSCHSLGLTF